MKIYIGLLICILSTSTLFGQYSLSGNITETNSQIPVLASLYITDLERGTATDLDGNFKINNLAPGRYNLVISALGYRVISTEIALVSKDFIQNFEMIPSAIEMEEVIVSTPFHNLQSDNVMRVSRVSADQLEQQGAVSLAEGITSVAGVSSVSTGVGIGKPVIRGLSANRVLTYTQGIRLENQQFGDEHGLGIDASGIESIEVIKGPASLLYGSDALGGVLYLNPERFAQENTSAADAGFSYYQNTRGLSTSAGYKASGERFKFLIRGARSSHSDYKIGQDLRVTNSRFGQYDLKSGVQFRSQKIKSELRYNFNSARLGIPESISTQTTQKRPEDPYQEIDSHIISLDNTLYFNSGSLDATFGFTHNNRIEFEQEDNQIIAALDLNLKTLTYDLKYNFKQFGDFEAIIGVQGLTQTNKNFGEEILIPDASKDDFGIMATGHWHLTKFDFMAGLRWDYRAIDAKDARDPAAADYITAVSRDFSSVNAALGAKYEPIEPLQLRVNLATGFRAPNLAELTSNGVHVGTNRYEVGNATLKQEQSFMTDVSVELKTEHFELIANGFYNSINDYIFVTPNGQFIEGNPVFDFAQSDASLYGGEFGLHLHPHPLDWLHLESTFETVTGKLDNDQYLPLLPANTLKNTLRLAFESSEKQHYGAFVNLTNVFDQNKVSQFESRTGGYGLLNLGLNSKQIFNKTTIRLSVVVNNITNKEFVSHLSRLKTDDIFNIGRSLVVGAKISLN